MKTELSDPPNVSSQVEPNLEQLIPLFKELCAKIRTKIPNQKTAWICLSDAVSSQSKLNPEFTLAIDDTRIHASSVASLLAEAEDITPESIIRLKAERLRIAIEAKQAELAELEGAQ